MWALGRFRVLIFCSRTVTSSDHNPLKYIRETATKSAKLLRLSLALAEFDLEIMVIEYTKGSENVVADFFCRDCEVITLHFVFCECDSFRGVPNCRCSLMNCVGLIESVVCCTSALSTSASLCTN